jgi:hypothetical protein
MVIDSHDTVNLAFRLTRAVVSVRRAVAVET